MFLFLPFHPQRHRKEKHATNGHCRGGFRGKKQEPPSIKACGGNNLLKHTLDESCDGEMSTYVVGMGTVKSFFQWIDLSGPFCTLRIDHRFHFVGNSPGPESTWLMLAPFSSRVILKNSVLCQLKYCWMQMEILENAAQYSRKWTYCIQNTCFMFCICLKYHL